MNVKQLGPLIGLAGTIAGAGTGAYKLTSDVIRSKLVTREEYVAAANERKVAEVTHSVQLAGWQSTLNSVVESQRDQAEGQRELAKKFDDLILRLLEERRRR